MKEIKIGDRVLYNKLFGEVHHAYIIAIVDGFFGKRYYGKWHTNDDFGRWEVAGRLYKHRIISVD